MEGALSDDVVIHPLRDGHRRPQYIDVRQVVQRNALRWTGEVDDEWMELNLCVDIDEYDVVVDAAGYALVASSLNRVRRRLGQDPVRRLFRWWLSPDLVIVLSPRWYATPQADWSTQIRLAAFGRFDGMRGNLAEDLRQFCEDGPPPILFTLGTGMTHATGFFRTTVEACNSLGARGVLVTKYADVIPPNISPSPCYFLFSLIRRLFPLCAVVVHHGGIGTTVAAPESECPQLALPLAWDQPDNAARVAKLGVGFALGRRCRTSANLSHALAHLMSPEVRDRCRAMASRADGDGLELAAKWVEELPATGTRKGESGAALEWRKRQ